MNGKLQAMQMDINNNCNLRCPFCINDWKNKGKTIYMDGNTFDKAMELLPAVDRGFLSCSFEPTIHPDFMEFFSRVPKCDTYTFITTNLAKKFTDEEIEKLANTNLDSITISVESFKYKLYEDLRKGAKFENFISNLVRLVKALKGKETPKIRFITIVLKQNLGELESIAKICNEKFTSTLNQFRTPWKGTRNVNNKEWVDESMITKKESIEARERIFKIPYKIGFFDPMYSVEGEAKLKVDNTLNKIFSVRSDGTIIFHEPNKKRLPEEFRKDFNIHDIDKPYEFFKKGLQKIK